MSDLVSSIGIASKIDEAVNAAYWQVMIKAIEREADKCGFSFVNVGEGLPLEILPRVLINRLSYALLFAQEKYKAAFKKDTDLHDDCERWFKDGVGHVYLQEVLNGLYELGFVLHKKEPSPMYYDDGPIEAIQMFGIDLPEIDDSGYYNKFYFNISCFDDQDAKDNQHDLIYSDKKDTNLLYAMIALGVVLGVLCVFMFKVFLSEEVPSENVSAVGDVNFVQPLITKPEGFRSIIPEFKPEHVIEPEPVIGLAGGVACLGDEYFCVVSQTNDISKSLSLIGDKFKVDDHKTYTLKISISEE